MIIFLMKVFKCARHADDLIEGRLYANTLAYFKKMEDGGVRGDEDEGAIMLQREGLIIELTATNQVTGEINRIRTSGDELAGPLIMRPEWFDHINVFCMYAGHTGDFKAITEQNVVAFKRQLEIPEECEQIGNHAVVIVNIGEFYRRVKAGSERSGYGVCGGLVKYYDSEVGTPVTRKDIDTVFTKRKEFEYQKEFRLAVDTGNMGCRPITLCIGRIDDIAIRTNTAEINRGLSVKHDSQPQS